MTNSIVTALSFESDEIRTTGDGRISVFDFIRVVGGVKSERQVYKRLSDQYPEVTKCDFWKFPGAKRKTPIMGREQTIKILQLLPGKNGGKNTLAP